MIIRITAIFCLLLAVALWIPLLVDLADGNRDWEVFAVTSALISFLSVFMIVLTNGRETSFNIRAAFILVTVLWMATSIVSALPYLFSVYDISFTDAVFEAVSGLTTTGSTVLSKIETLPRGLLLWRSTTQWLGGIGIVAMGIFIMPLLRNGGMQFFKLESSDRADKPVARIETFSKLLVSIYLSLTALNIILYAMAGMTWFDAINHAFTTISSGGFSTRDASMMEENYLVLSIAIVFMLAAALPFTLYMGLLLRSGGMWKDGQMTVLVSMIMILTALMVAFAEFPVSFRSPDKIIHSLFTVTSLVTTTGYASIDHLTWGPAILGITLIATFIGGAAGSTSGGFKTYRLMILFKVIWVTLKELRYPNGVFPVYFRGQQIGVNALKAILAFTAAFILTLALGTVGLTMTGLDFDTSFSGALTALANVGPGWGPRIGPSGNFSELPDVAKWILTTLMLLGRLEIMTVFILITPTFWEN